MPGAASSPDPTVTIPGRFVGPPASGNGGYSCGTFAGLLGGPAEVTLTRPVPLEQPLNATAGADGEATIAGEAGVIAEVRSIEGLPGLEPPIRPTLEAAERFSAGSPFLTDRHPYPGCFVCGSEHPDGLGVYAGPTDADADVGAAPFDPGPSVPSSAGALEPEIVWAVLDCPSYTPRLFRSGVPHLLGRLSVEQLAAVPSAEPSVIVGWELESEGRKLHSACAVLSPEGDLLARSRALWIAAKG
jgi:hypothetical protein